MKTAYGTAAPNAGARGTPGASAQGGGAGARHGARRGGQSAAGVRRLAPGAVCMSFVRNACPPGPKSVL